MSKTKGGRGGGSVREENECERLIGSKREGDREGGGRGGTAETAERRSNLTEAICFTSLEQYGFWGGDTVGLMGIDTSKRSCSTDENQHSALLLG